MQINQIKNFLLGSVEDNEKSVLESSEEVLSQSPPIPNDALIIVPMRSTVLLPQNVSIINS